MRAGYDLREPGRVLTRSAASACHLELRHLRAFVAVVDEGSVTAAARTLKVAQSTVSEALSALERALGAPVVSRRRGTPHSVLTPAGRALLLNARELLSGVERTYVAVAEAALEARGAVSIVANESVSTYILPRVLGRLRTSRPNTQFSVSVATCSEIRRGIEDGTFDVGLALQPAVDSGVPIAAKVRPDDGYQVLAPLVPLVIFATPAHPLSAAPRKSIARTELSCFVVFTSDSAGEFHDLIRNFLNEDGLPAARLFSAGSVEGVKRGVLSDHSAVGILPGYAIEEEILAGRLVPLHVTPTPPALQLVALQFRARKSHPGLVQLTDEIRNTLRIPPHVA
jgi:molybdate transport repressor ModE-like protein